MKKKIVFVCEICGEEHEEKKPAIQCEKKGHPEMATIGQIFPYDGIGIACVAHCEVVKGNKHLAQVALWMCRHDRNIGDTLGDFPQTCGGGFTVDGQHKRQLRPEDLQTDAFKRMLKHLKKKGIIPHHFDNLFNLKPLVIDGESEKYQK